MIFFKTFRYEELCHQDAGQLDEDEPLDRCQVKVTTAPARPRLRIREDVREQHCKTLRQALHVWLDQFTEDYDDPPNYPCLTQLEAFCRKMLPNTELDIKVHRKASQIRRPPEPQPPPHKLGYPNSQAGRPPPLLLKSANLINNNSVHMHGYAKESSSDYLNHPQASPASETVGSGSSSQFSDFTEIPESLFARQLTRMDCVSALKL